MDKLLRTCYHVKPMTTFTLPLQARKFLRQVASFPPFILNNLLRTGQLYVHYIYHWEHHRRSHSAARKLWRWLNHVLGAAAGMQSFSATICLKPIKSTQNTPDPAISLAYTTSNTLRGDLGLDTAGGAGPC